MVISRHALQVGLKPAGMWGGYSESVSVALTPVAAGGYSESLPVGVPGAVPPVPGAVPVVPGLPSGPVERLWTANLVGDSTSVEDSREIIFRRKHGEGGRTAADRSDLYNHGEQEKQAAENHNHGVCLEGKTNNLFCFVRWAGGILRTGVVALSKHRPLFDTNLRADALALARGFAQTTNTQNEVWLANLVLREAGMAPYLPAPDRVDVFGWRVFGRASSNGGAGSGATGGGATGGGANGGAGPQDGGATGANAQTLRKPTPPTARDRLPLALYNFAHLVWFVVLPFFGLVCALAVVGLSWT